MRNPSVQGLVYWLCFSMVCVSQLVASVWTLLENGGCEGQTFRGTCTQTVIVESSAPVLNRGQWLHTYTCIAWFVYVLCDS